jgi:hypothetical protein
VTVDASSGQPTKPVAAIPDIVGERYEIQLQQVICPHTKHPQSTVGALFSFSTSGSVAGAQSALPAGFHTEADAPTKLKEMCV